MIRKPLSQSVGALATAVICLVVLFGMIALNAWPLWYGRSVLLPAISSVTRGSSLGDYASVATPAMKLVIRPDGSGGTESAAAVRPVGRWWNDPVGTQAGHRSYMRGATIYVQLEDAGNGVFRPVTVSRDRVPGALNLQGLIRRVFDGDVVGVDYGLDAFYMKQGEPRTVESAIRDKRHVQLEVAIAASGRARIRNVLIDGAEVGHR